MIVEGFWSTNDMRQLINIWESAISKYQADNTGATHAIIALDAKSFGSYIADKSNDELIKNIHENFGLLERCQGIRIYGKSKSH